MLLSYGWFFLALSTTNTILSSEIIERHILFVARRTRDDIGFVDRVSSVQYALMMLLFIPSQSVISAIDFYDDTL